MPSLIQERVTQTRHICGSMFFLVSGAITKGHVTAIETQLIFIVSRDLVMKKAFVSIIFVTLNEDQYVEWILYV